MADKLRPEQIEVTTGVSDNDTIPTLGKVEDMIGTENLWDRVTGTPNYLLPHTVADDIGATGARINKGWFDDLNSTALTAATFEFSGDTMATSGGMNIASTTSLTMDAGSTITIQTAANDIDLIATDGISFEAQSGDITFNLTGGGDIVFTDLALANGILQIDGTGDVSSSITLPDGTLCTTQAPLDNSTKLASTAYVDAAVTVEDIWDRDTVGAPYIKPKNTGDFLHLNDEESTTWSTSEFQIFRNNAATMTFWSATATASADSDLNLVRSRGTIGTYAAVQDGDLIGNINWVGATSASNFNNGAEINAEVNGAVSAGVLPCDLVFYVNAGAGTATEGMRLLKTKDLEIQGNVQVDKLVGLTTSTTFSLDKLTFDTSATGFTTISSSDVTNVLTLDGGASSAIFRLDRGATNQNGKLEFHTATAEKWSVGLIANEDDDFLITGGGTTGDIKLIAGSSSGKIILDPGSEGVLVDNVAVIGNDVTMDGSATIKTTSGDLILDSVNLRFDSATSTKVNSGTFALPSGTTVNNIVTGIGSLSTDNMLATAKTIYDDFAYLGGKIGGQTLSGGFGLNEDLDLQSTFAATKGEVRVRDGSDFLFDGAGNGIFKVEPNADAKIYLARSMISSPTTDVMFFSHYDMGDSTTDYAIKQLASGRTAINSATGVPLDLNINNVTQVSIDATTMTINGGQQVKRTASAVDYNPSVLTTDYIIAITDTSAPRAVTISTEDIQSGSTTRPRIFVVKDESGGAGANSITVSGETGNIDGAANAVISQNYAALTIYADGTNLFIY